MVQGLLDCPVKPGHDDPVKKSVTCRRQQARGEARSSILRRRTQQGIPESGGVTAIRIDPD
jgi:hypothetical protein